MSGPVYRRMGAAFGVLAAVVMTLSLAACGGGGGDTGGANVSAPPAVGTVTVALPNPQLQVGAQQTASAEVRSTAGTVLSGRAISWASSNTAVATVTDAGVVTGVTPGAVNITATSEGKVGTAALTVVVAPVNAVVVSAPSSTLVTERTLQASATLRDERGATLSGRTVTWSSSAPAVATVSDAGFVTGVAAGSVVITATSEGKSGTLAFTVVPPTVNIVIIALAQATIAQGTTTTATVQLRDDRNVTLTGRTVSFASSDPTVASVTDAGVITALAVGSTTITATSEGKSASASLTVIQPPVASVTVALSQNVIAPGGTAQAQVVLRDVLGRTLTGRPVTYGTTNPSVATVNGAGLVSAIAPGVAIITASSEGQTGQVTLQVLVPVASVVFNGSTRVKVGDSYNYTVTARAADGTVLNRPVLFRVRETARAQMTPDGVLTPLQTGTITMVALIDGNEWDATYTSYDWVNLSGSGSTFEYLDADVRVSNRLGTLEYPQMVLACSSTGSFFVWVRTPHIITQNGVVAFSFDGGTPTAQTWGELSPDFTTLWKQGGNSTVKSFATQIAASRRFGFAFGEFSTNLTKTTQFRVTGLTPRLINLFALCPAALMAPGTAAATEPSLAERADVMRVFTAGTAISAFPSADAARRARAGASETTNRTLEAWPTWIVPEATRARRIKQ